MTDVEFQSLEDQLKMIDIVQTADRLELCHHYLYAFGDVEQKPIIKQLAIHYQELTGMPYHHVWNHEYNGCHK